MDPDDLHRPPAELVAAIDQMLASAGELARGMRGYYEALLDAGFEEAQALPLVIAWQAVALQGGS